MTPEDKQFLFFKKQLHLFFENHGHTVVDIPEKGGILIVELDMLVSLVEQKPGLLSFVAQKYIAQENGNVQ